MSIYLYGRAISQKECTWEHSSLIWAFWKFNRALGGLTTAVSVFVNSTNITTNIERAALSSKTPSLSNSYTHRDLNEIYSKGQPKEQKHVHGMLQSSDIWPSQLPSSERSSEIFFLVFFGMGRVPHKYWQLVHESQMHLSVIWIISTKGALRLPTFYNLW